MAIINHHDSLKPKSCWPFAPISPASVIVDGVVERPELFLQSHISVPPYATFTITITAITAITKRISMELELPVGKREFVG